MWKVVVIICALGSPCVIMEENPMRHYKNYNDCIKVAEEKHKLIVESFQDYGYYVDESNYKCEQLDNSQAF